MLHFRFLPLALLGALTLPATLARAQRVTTAQLPLPLPGTSPVAPDRLRAQNPWNLPMNGLWRFRLTHGQLQPNGMFARSRAEVMGLRASSSQSANPPENAFDGDPETRWCAAGGAFPQWLQMDLGRELPVSAVAVLWERDAEKYRCRVEGSADARVWTPLTSANAEKQSVGNGPLAITPRAARYVRVTVLGVSATGWASLRELNVQYKNAQGILTTWRPAKPDLTVAAGSDDFAQPNYDDHTWDTLQDALQLGNRRLFHPDL